PFRRLHYGAGRGHRRWPPRPLCDRGGGAAAGLERLAGDSGAPMGFGRGPASLPVAELLGLDAAAAPDYGRRRTRRPNPRRVHRPPRGPASLRTPEKFVAPGLTESSY